MHPIRYVRALLEKNDDLRPKEFVRRTKKLAAEAEGDSDGASLEGCSGAEIDVAERMLDEALESGRALAGRGSAADHLYTGTADDLAKKLGPGCGGLSRFLALSRESAERDSDHRDTLVSSSLERRS